MKLPMRAASQATFSSLLFFLFFFLSSSAIAQTVTGKVSNNQGEPLAAITVSIKGQATAVTTDAEGRFTIQAASTAVLVFTSVGYLSQEVAVGGRTNIEVQLAPDSKSLDVVIVTALGLRRDVRKLGYATATVDPEQLTTARTTNLGNSLQGKVAGVNVSPPAGGPGGSSKIRIRGQSSFGGNNSPLIVVNGIPINNTSIPATKSSEITNGNPTGGSSDQGDGLQSINQDDIESMTVLKGAAASALYGFRAKDGVIIITTKSGKGQKGIGVELNSSFQADQALDFTDFQYEYGQGENGVRPATISDAQSSGVWSFGEKFDGKETPQFDGTMKPYLANKDRIKDFYRTGTSFTNSVALSGGNEKGNFRLAFANTDADAIVPNSDFHKKILNLGLTYRFTDKLSAQLNANYSNEYNRNPPQIGIQDMSANTTIYTLANSIDVAWLEATYKTPEGNEQPLARFTNRNNPYWVAYQRFERVHRDRIFGNVSLRYQLLDWLYVQGRIGQDYYTRPYEYNRPTGTRSIAAAPTGFNGYYYQDITTFRERNADFLIGGNKTFSKFGVDLTLGGNSLYQAYDNMGTAVTNFYVRDLYTIMNGQTKNTNYKPTRKKVNSLYGALELSFDNYLFLNLTARRDWFSTLNPNSNAYTYPSASLSFVFSDALKLPQWFTYGKIRAAYAEVGGDTEPYQTQLYYTINSNPLAVNVNGANGNIALGTSGAIAPNNSLRPLKIKESEVGLELKFFNNRVGLDVSYYDKKTIDEILNVDVSYSSGFNQTKVNIGKLKNQGIEALLSIIPVETRNTRWETVFNMSYNKSKVLQLAEGQQKFDVGSGEFFGTISHEVGKPLASLRGFDYKRDEKGDIITTGGLFSQGEQVTYGSAIPKWVGAWINTINWKNFRIFTQVDFKADYKILSNSNLNFYREGLSKATLVGRENGVVFDAVNPDGSPNTTAVPVEQFFTQYRSTNIGTPFLYDGSFVRWRTLSIGYNLTDLFSGKSFIKGLTVSLMMNNVLMIKKYIENLDPEAQVSASDNYQGIETHTLPTTRTYGISVNVKL